MDVICKQNDISNVLVKVKPSHRDKLPSNLYDSDLHFDIDELRLELDTILKNAINYVFFK